MKKFYVWSRDGSSEKISFDTFANAMNYVDVMPTIKLSRVSKDGEEITLLEVIKND